MNGTERTIADDHVVVIHFTARGDQGELLESTQGGPPLAYLHGAGNLVPGLEAALAGRRRGDSFEVVLAPAQAFGERIEELDEWHERQQFADIEPLEVGMQLVMSDEGGHSLPVWVAEVDAQRVRIDGNHPFCGRTLHYAVEVLEVRPATGAELDHGHPHDGDCGG
jgi:FKBP-type peptidyl-prolyl cis-trans isomerase SlyD